ncbi:MAG: protein-disulfide reductase DsbD family protein, partial [Chlamydiales bacterium]
MRRILTWARLILPLIFILSGVILAPLHAEEVKAPLVERSAEPVSAQLLSENSSIAAGQPFWVGVELKLAPGWDTYWINPGDAGLPTKIDWQLPAGFKAGPIQWPYPEKFTNDQMVGFGYTGSVLLMTKITPPSELKAGEKIDLQADVTWLACKDSCQPGSAQLVLQIPIAEKAELNPTTGALFIKERTKLPQTLTRKEGRLTVSAKDENIVLNLQLEKNLPQIKEMVFIPAQGDVIDYGAPQKMELDRGGITLNMKRSQGGVALPSEMKGVLVVSQVGSPAKYVIQVDTHILELAQKHLVGFSSFMIAIGLAFVGGLILNVMPCVMPVIALKIFSFVKMANERRRVIFQHGMLFGLGVLISFWALAGGLLLLRSFGSSVGWGFQLQEPAFVAVLIAILFLLGLSLFGLFELGTSLISLGSKTKVHSSPYLSSFMSGVLATLVATPCTGPLLGPALGLAMTLSPVKSLMIFTGMGLGMASPYLIFAAFPKLIRFLPKPGNWMTTFKQVMGFLMMATVGWLVWVFAAQTGHTALLVLLISLVIMAIGGWIFGRWGTPLKSKMTRGIATLLAIALIGFSGYGTISAARKFEAVPQQQIAASDDWQAYTPEKVQQLRSDGKSVFIDFTAKWCLICQTNKVILHSSGVMKEFQERGVVTLTADWTKRDATITKQLEKLGRSGVPVYVLYPADIEQEPYILPQNLTAKVIHDYLEKLNVRPIPPQDLGFRLRQSPESDT